MIRLTLRFLIVSAFINLFAGQAIAKPKPLQIYAIDVEADRRL
jgi:hypothetical protein